MAVNTRQPSPPRRPDTAHMSRRHSRARIPYVSSFPICRPCPVRLISPLLRPVHYQGIIHRDIKPANLLWTADRRTVKISDFGVSTFSYAQRLAAAGNGNIKDDDTDPILMDESDLSKTAGTPMFLAPEIVADVPLGSELSGSSTQLPHAHPPFHSQPRRKPSITKAIDVWAFGVTLYGLLFGELPFHAKTEYEIYQVIRLQDWNAPETMGLDAIPTGGRHPRLLQRSAEDSEGTLVIDLLERLLEKDCRKRITLDQVKVRMHSSPVSAHPLGHHLT